MPELPIIATQTAMTAPPMAAVLKPKNDLAKYSEIIDSVNKFANSDVGKMLIQRVLPKDNVVGNPQPAQGEHKPMPQQAPITSPFYDGGDVGPARPHLPAPPQVVVKEVVKEVPMNRTPSQLYDESLSGIMQLSEQLGADKTLGEAVEWIRANKAAIILHFSMQKK